MRKIILIIGIFLVALILYSGYRSERQAEAENAERVRRSLREIAEMQASGEWDRRLAEEAEAMRLASGFAPTTLPAEEIDDERPECE